MMLSSTLMPLKSARLWKVRAMPRAAASCGSTCWRTLPAYVILPSCGWYTPLITLSIELLPAPFGPMIARISCSRTSNETSCSARTPPNESETPSTLRIGSPILRACCIRTASGRLLRRLDRVGLRVGDLQGRADRAGPAVLEAHLRLDEALALAAVKRGHERSVLVGD